MLPLDLSSWASTRHPNLGSRALVRRGEWALGTLVRLGAAPPPASRLPRALALIRRFDERPASLPVTDEALLRRGAHAQRTVWQLFVVTVAAPRRARTSQPWFPLGMLQDALGGAESPDGDRHTKARDTEFELYVASVLALAGATVRFCEPDLKVVVPGGAAGIACKRLTSRKADKLATRLRGAALQIERSGRPGYVAVDAGVFFGGESLAPDEPARRAQFRRWAEVVLRAVGRSMGKRPQVMGVLAFGYADAWDVEATPPLHVSAYPASFQLLTDDEESAEQVAEREAFWTRIQRNMDAEIGALHPATPG